MELKRKSVVIVAFYLMIVSIVLLLQSDLQPRKLENEVTDGTLFHFYEDKQYLSELTDFCVKDGCLYVLYGGRGVVKIYDNSGQYKESYAFLKSKGESSLSVDEDCVYLFDQKYNYYVFSSGKYTSFVKYSDYHSYLQKKATCFSDEEKRKSGDTQYYLQCASIYQKNADNSSCQVIHRPLYLMFFQGILPFVVIVFYLILLFAFAVSEKRVPQVSRNGNG